MLLERHCVTIRKLCQDVMNYLRVVDVRCHVLTPTFFFFNFSLKHSKISNNDDDVRVMSLWITRN